MEKQPKQEELPQMPDKPEYTRLADRLLGIRDNMKNLRDEREKVATQLVEEMRKARVRRWLYGERTFSVIDQKRLKIEQRK